MKFCVYILIFLIFSCTSIPRGKKEIVSEKTILETNEFKNIELTFEKTQDSLRKRLLNSKPNENLKSSILQELYIRGLVNQVQDKIKFELPFNLHGFDCGAPDCFSTDITFEIKAKKPIEFPKKINFQLIEHGCGIENKVKENGIFELVEQSSKYVNYYSKKQQSNLVIIGDKKELYYFPDTKPNSIKVDLIETLFKEYDEENPKFTEPYQSTIMRYYDYGDFIKKE